MSDRDFSLAYCTNFWSHHQAPVCTELISLLGENRFKMCLFEPVDEERRQMGWGGDAPDRSWLAGPPVSRSDLKTIGRIICDADVAVLNSCPHEIQVERVATGKLTFIMSERLMRKKFFRLRMINPRFRKGIQRLRSVVNRTNVHYLAVGAYAGADAKIIGVFRDRIWNWAYFVSQSVEEVHKRTTSPVQLLWAGRFIYWKQVDVILRALSMLDPACSEYALDLIGSGPKHKAMKQLAERLGLTDKVRFLENMPHAAVRQRMAEADVYILPSNHLEGWGAVVGEAMFEGCVVLASVTTGASKMLIENSRTGFLFSDGDAQELAGILGQIIKNADLRCQVGQAAAQHMQQLWHPRIGAERLVGLCQGLLGLAPMPVYQKGPCSHWAPY